MDKLKTRRVHLPNDVAHSLIKQKADIHKDEKGYYINGWIQEMRPSPENWFYNPYEKYLCWWQPGASEPVGIKIYHNQLGGDTT